MDTNGALDKQPTEEEVADALDDSDYIGIPLHPWMMVWIKKKKILAAALRAAQEESMRLREALVDYKDLVSHHVEWTAKGREMQAIHERLEKIDDALKLQDEK
jgi:hypothetical protein